MLLLQTPWGQPCSVLGKSGALISRELFFLDNFPGWDHALTFTDQYYMMYCSVKSLYLKGTHLEIFHHVMLQSWTVPHRVMQIYTSHTHIHVHTRIHMHSHILTVTYIMCTHTCSGSGTHTPAQLEYGAI